MRLLVLGGTVFLGRHAVDAALARGDQVTILHRGKHPSHRPGEVEELLGDRDGGLDALAGRTFDAVIDTSGYVPRVVADSARLLADSGFYVFVSTGNVYADLSRGLHEGRPLHEPPADTEEVRVDTYGPLKVGCERAVQEVFGGRSLIVRAGLIVGPDDATNRFTYWVTRIAEGGEVLVPDAADQPLQVVDVRDLGAWLVEAARHRRSGTVNVEGPRGRTTFGGLLALIREVTGSGATLRPVPAAFLERHGVQPWQDLPLWLPVPELQGMVDGDDTLARQLGMTFRPYEATIADTLAWARTAPPAQGLDTGVGVRPAGISREREAELLAAYAAEE